MPACISKSSGLDSRALAKLAVRRRVAGPACRPARPWKAPGKAPGTRGAVGRARALLGSDAPGGGAPARCDAARRAADPGSPCHAMSRWADMLLGGRGARWIGRWARNSVLLSQGCSQLSAVVRFGAYLRLGERPRAPRCRLGVFRANASMHVQGFAAEAACGLLGGSRRRFCLLERVARVAASGGKRPAQPLQPLRAEEDGVLSIGAFRRCLPRSEWPVRVQRRPRRRAAGGGRGRRSIRRRLRPSERSGSRRPRSSRNSARI